MYINISFTGNYIFTISDGAKQRNRAGSVAEENAGQLYGVQARADTPLLTVPSTCFIGCR